ncbi:MAG: universal stress protein [Candidatus Dormiibacterota bacterium]
MYRRIVLAVDPEGLAESVLPLVAALARRSGGEVFVVGAAKASDPPEHRAALEKQVREASGELNAAGVTAHGEVRHVAGDSSAAAEIVAACGERAADLVALGSHGRGNIAALLEGSVGRQVLSQVEAPAILVHSREAAKASFLPRPLRRILVPVDYSETSRQAVKEAADLAREEGAALLILHVREMVPFGDVPYIEGPEEAQQLIHELTAGLPTRDVSVESRISEPMLNPVQEIVEAAEKWNADLIVLGSRRLTAAGGLFLGGVAQGVVKHSSRPVLMAGHPTHQLVRGGQRPAG